MRLGFVGVGRWAQKLAAAFRACGAEIVAYDRRTGVERWSNELMGQPHLNDVPHMSHGLSMGPDLDGFGRYLSWRDQLTDPSIDAIIAVAPPDVTTEVALACAAAGKAVCATKPLFDHPETIRAPFYVDFWRLWSDVHQDALDDGPREPRVILCGSGPDRGFPGAFDYGPHVMAALLDFDPDAKLKSFERAVSAHGELFHCTYSGSGGGEAFVSFGNGAANSERVMWGSVELPTRIGYEKREGVLQSFCQSFLNDISESFVDTRLLRLSRDGMRELKRIREMAK